MLAGIGRRVTGMVALADARCRRLRRQRCHDNWWNALLPDAEDCRKMATPAARLLAARHPLSAVLGDGNHQ